MQYVQGRGLIVRVSPLHKSVLDISFVTLTRIAQITKVEGDFVSGYDIYNAVWFT